MDESVWLLVIRGFRLDCGMRGDRGVWFRSGSNEEDFGILRTGSVEIGVIGSVETDVLLRSGSNEEGLGILSTGSVEIDVFSWADRRRLEDDEANRASSCAIEDSFKDSLLPFLRTKTTPLYV